MEAGLFSRVTGYAAVSALISTRFYPFANIPEDVSFPFAHYEIQREATYTHAGETGYQKTQVLIRAVSRTYDECKSIRNAVRDCLSGYIGAAGLYTFQACFLLQETDAVDVPDSGQEFPLFVAEMLFRICHVETKPALG